MSSALETLASSGPTGDELTVAVINASPIGQRKYQKCFMVLVATTWQQWKTKETQHCNLSSSQMSYSIESASLPMEQMKFGVAGSRSSKRLSSSLKNQLAGTHCTVQRCAEDMRVLTRRRLCWWLLSSPVSMRLLSWSQGKMRSTRTLPASSDSIHDECKFSRNSRVMSLHVCSSYRCQMKATHIVGLAIGRRD